MSRCLPSFWDEPSRHSKLKHTILEGYLTVFATKTASTPHEVVFLDGYAGAGQYLDGSPGSPLIALDLAQRMAGYRSPRNLRCVFVEKTQCAHQVLDHVVAGRAMCVRGDVERKLPELMRHAAGKPLLAFLDPFGHLPDPETLVENVLWRPQEGRRQSTEMLVSLMTFSVQRQQGHLRSSDPTAAQAGTIESTERFIGAPEWKTATSDRKIAELWASKIESLTSGRFEAWAVPIPKRWEARDYYYMVLVTKHPQGGWFFAASLRDAYRKFYELGIDQDGPALLDPEEYARQAASEMRVNIKRLLEERGQFRMEDHTREIYGDTLTRGGLQELVTVTRGLEQNDELKVVKGTLSRKMLHKAVVRPGRGVSLF